MFKVTRAFLDSQDNNRLYNVGDAYPADGVKVAKGRIKSLLDGTNKNGKVYLEEVEEPAKDPNPADNPEEKAEEKSED